MYFEIQKDYTGYPSRFVLIVNMLPPIPFRLLHVKYQRKPERFDRDQWCHFEILLHLLKGFP